MVGDMPFLTPEYETTVSNIFIVGELGGLALIKNAVNQGRDCIDTIASRLTSNANGSHPQNDVYDVVDRWRRPGGNQRFSARHRKQA